MSAMMPTAAPIPALAAVESPDEEDVLLLTFGLAFVVGFVFAEAVDAMVEEAGEAESVFDVAVPTTVPNNYMDVILQILPSSWKNVR
jgi:hypothetical protein